MRIVLKPSRAVTVRVKDAADGQPVPGATVEAAEMLFRTHATAGADGTATLRIPADAQRRVGDRVPASGRLRLLREL